MVSSCIKGDQERRSTHRYGPGFNGVSRPGDGNRPLITRQALQGFGHHKLSQNLGPLHRFCHDEGEPLSECLYLNSGRLRESPKIAAAAGLLDKIWTEVISHVPLLLIRRFQISLSGSSCQAWSQSSKSYPNTPPCSWWISWARRRISSIFSSPMASGLAAGTTRVSD